MYNVCGVSLCLCINGTCDDGDNDYNEETISALSSEFFLVIVTSQIAVYYFHHCQLFACSRCGDILFTFYLFVL